MPWLNAVQNRILEELQGRFKMRERLFEVLRWRGFLAYRDRGHLRLYRGAAVADQNDLDCLGAIESLHVLPSEEALDHCAEVRWKFVPPPPVDAVIAGILRLPAPTGMTGIFEHLNFGYDFPATELDQGVALLVRALGRLGLRTKVSGHGETRCRLYVEFTDDDTGLKFRRFFEAEFAGRVVNPQVFTSGRGEYGTTALFVGHETDDEEAAYRFFCAAQELGRLILDRPMAGITDNVPDIAD